MEKSSSKLDSNSVKNILTLRYNPTKKSKFTKKTWKDFTEKPSDISPQIIENLI
ncbi:MAG: asparagine synthase, partial [Nitrosarchaeum sp.]|nr:asparagine synthase [Nitrosarchaeum sp.]